MNLSEEIKISSVNKNHEEKWRLYRDLIHSLPLAGYIVDKNGYVIIFNEAATELWGRQPEIGKDRWCGSWKIYESNGTTEVPLHKYPVALAFKEQEKNSNSHPLIVERPDGSKRYFVSYPKLILDPDHNVEGAITMLVDVTEI